MGEMDFYIDSLSNLPARLDNTESFRERATRIFYDFMELAHLYESAITVVKSYLDILNNEFNLKYQRNPIHNIEDRLKSPQSIIGKLEKKGLPLTTDAAKKTFSILQE